MSKFSNFQAQAIHCFGFMEPKAHCWLELLKKDANAAVSQQKDVFENNLKSDVNASYQHLATFKIVDLDTTIEYVVKFLNDKKVWDIEIADSPTAEVDIKDKIDFFRTYLMKKLVERADAIMTEALDKADILREVMEDGKLLKVDETKFEAIVDGYLVDQTLRKNFKNRTYMK